ncbi:MAG: hypothetical protein ABSA21_08030 [Candidatus Limnocylindrales bacterium]|jgi:hypothetical protein
MQHSIAAKYAARPAACFVRPAGSERERRLGLHASLSFQRAAARVTILRPSRGGLHMSGWRPATSTRPGIGRSGVVRPAVTIRWAGLGGSRADSRSILAPAPWRG